jgi:HopA1 effector protein family
MSEYRQFVAAVGAALEIESPTTFTWFDRRSEHSTWTGLREWPASAARDYLRHALGLELYAHAYCPGAPVPAVETPRSWPPRRFTTFAATLSDGNTGRGSWDPGWTALRREDGQLVVQRDGLSLWIDPSHARQASADEGAPEGVSVRLPKELCKLSPGFYVALGDRGLALDDPPPLVRVYWNVGSAHAPQLVRALTARLNADELSFRFKVVDQPDRYDRCDAAVLYLAAADYELAEPAIEGVYGEAQEWLRPGTPGFTKRLGPGLALAEDPGTGESFGMSRALMLAEALIAAHEAGVEDDDGRVEIAAATFAAVGVELDRPYLNGGAPDRYRPLEAVLAP